MPKEVKNPNDESAWRLYQTAWRFSFVSGAKAAAFIASLGQSFRIRENTGISAEGAIHDFAAALRTCVGLTRAFSALRCLPS